MTLIKAIAIPITLGHFPVKLDEKDSFTPSGTWFA